MTAENRVAYDPRLVDSALPERLRRFATEADAGGVHVLARPAFAVAAALCLTPWASPPIALASGVALALILGNHSATPDSAWRADCCRRASCCSGSAWT